MNHPLHPSLQRFELQQLGTIFAVLGFVCPVSQIGHSVQKGMEPNKTEEIDRILTVQEFSKNEDHDQSDYKLS